MYYGPYPKYPTYTSFTSYINSNNISDIAQIITNVITQENGYELLPELPYSVINTKSLSIYQNKRPPLLIVALASGENGWV